ncbi:hypothetical protein EVAR_102898_1 [Eumeta japonica]|uniref:Uncharacterized protein n=1 Tax=Eumeta variegata TaxID=151549 RepID=A0A4C1ZQP4_EUMVA|nr:hypothetical protein EVAR_102898_1 [Eumeta japonica]
MKVGSTQWRCDPCVVCVVSRKNRCRNSDVRERRGFKEDVVTGIERGECHNERPTRTRCPGCFSSSLGYRVPCAPCPGSYRVGMARLPRDLLHPSIFFYRVSVWRAKFDSLGSNNTAVKFEIRLEVDFEI